MSDNIELFPGSKADLENMTGETYEAMKYKSGKLMYVDVYIPGQKPIKKKILKE